MFPSHKYIIKKNKITIYLLHNILFLAIVLFVGLFILTFPTLIFLKSVAGNLELSELLIYFISFCFILSPIFIASQIKISINLNTGTVYKHFIIFKHKLINLNQVDNIALIERQSGHYYSLIPKNNTYSKGYKISGNYFSKHAKALADFLTDVLPLIESHLIPTEHETDEGILNNPIFYNQHGYIFAVKPHHKIYQYIMLFAIAALWVWIIFFFNHFQTWYWFTILPALIYIHAISQRKYIDIQNKCLVTKSLWTHFPQTYSLNNFTGFLIGHGEKSPFAEGTTVYMKFDTNKGEKEVVLRDFGRSKHVERFMAETEAILNKADNEENVSLI